MFGLETAANATGLPAFTIHTRRGGFAGYVTSNKDGRWDVWFNANCTKGSKRKFPSVDAAILYIRDRRIKKGWGV
jgi:hypothetical protein